MFTRSFVEPELAESIARARHSFHHRLARRIALQEALAQSRRLCDDPGLRAVLEPLQDSLLLTHLDPEEMEAVAEDLEAAMQAMVTSLRQGAENLRTKPVNED